MSTTTRRRAGGTRQAVQGAARSAPRGRSRRRGSPSRRKPGGLLALTHDWKFQALCVLGFLVVVIVMAAALMGGSHPHPVRVTEGT